MDKALILLIFNLIAWGVIIAGLILARKFIKTEKAKDGVFIAVSVLTVLLHYSSLLTEYIENGNVELGSNMFLPAYPCNVIMWLCTTCSFLMIIGKKNGRFFTHTAEFTFLIGTICGFIGMGFNFNFLDNPCLSDWSILKGLLSHGTMIFNCIYLFTMGYVKISTPRNILSCIFGSILFILCGLYTNGVMALLGKPDENSMYLQAPPFEGMPYLNIFTMGLAGIILIAGLTTLYEVVFYKKEEIWFNKLKDKLKNEGEQHNA